MEKSTSSLTKEYIRENPSIKSCLKRGLINYSALSRKIAKDLSIENKTSKEAILVACRRYEDKLKDENKTEKEITGILEKSSISIKNKIAVFTLNKKFNMEVIEDAQKSILEKSGIFYILEGSDNYTIITQSKFSELIKAKGSDNKTKI